VTSNGTLPRDRPRLRAAVAGLGLLTALGMVIVLIAGDPVTDTGSEHGCGPSWPHCHGQFIPQFAVTTAIEFTHRAVVGVETVLVALLVIGLLLLYWRRASAWVISILLVGTLFLQAGLGAWAVMVPVNAWILATHFGVSLLCFAGALLAAAAARWPDRMLEPQATPRGVVAAVWGSAVYLYVMVYSGAYVAHAGAQSACGTDWPLCTPLGSPELVAVNLIHRTGAVITTLVAIGLLLFLRRRAPGRRDLIAGAWWLLATVVAQALAGGVLVLSDQDLFGQLLHAGVMAFPFGALAILCFRVSLRPRAAESASGAATLVAQPGP
jgi:cytochrome c oxidase assembly protein subunit 15